MLVGGQRVARLVVEGGSNAVGCVSPENAQIQTKTLFKTKFVLFAGGAKDVALSAKGQKTSPLSKGRF